jgi:5-methyltetrahydropteroyltriglutamate--homocysteine methyltransferase
MDALAADIRDLKAAVAEHGAAEAFMPSISPTNVEDWQANEYYGSDEEFLFAIAEVMREEYRAIVESGLLLQIDDPGLLTQYTMRPDWSVEDVRAWGRVRVDAVNHALRGLPADRIRFHTCYSINQGPRKYQLGWTMSSTWCWGSTRALTPSRLPTRATNTNGACGSRSISLRKRCRYQGSSRTRR